MKPILKWAGGKHSILETVFEHFPKTMENYHEPFLGGGSVLFHLLHLRQKGEITVKGGVHAYDNNPRLIQFYKDLQGDFPALLCSIERLEKAYNSKDKKEQEEYFYEMRKEFNRNEGGSALFLFLNKTAFRGLYREGKNGFNVPFGNYKQFFMDKGHLEELHHIIQGVSFTHCDFEVAFQHIKEGDFVYLDPPYFPVKATSFVDYTKAGFSLDKHLKLFELSKEKDFLMSNAYADTVVENFPSEQFQCQIFDCKRRINSKNPNDKAKEVLIWKK